MSSRDIDNVINAVRLQHPAIQVEQLKVKFPADDDGIWFFTHPASRIEVQFESSTGTFPFVVESNGHSERVAVTTVADAISLVQSWLGLAEAV